jgi:hypothetical protein
MNPRKRSERLLLATLLVATLGASANAYVDPGTGSLFTQILLAGALGGAFAFKNFWGRFWRGLTQRAAKPSASVIGRDEE